MAETPWKNIKISKRFRPTFFDFLENRCIPEKPSYKMSTNF